MIELIHLQKSLRRSTPIKDVNAVINDGDVIAIIGPSGTGKSTLLRCINLIDPPSGGKIIFNGEEITARGYDVKKVRRRIGMVFQNFNLFGHMTAIENIMYAPRKLLGKSRQEAYDEAMKLLKKVGLAERAFRYPDEMSGGNKQRVAIARTLAMDPEVILFDEPTNSLDPAMVGEVEAVIRDLSGSGKTLLIVTNDMRFSRSICNRVFYMDEGIIYEEGKPEDIFEHPEKEKTRRFIQYLKVLELNIESHNYDFLGDGAAIDQYCHKNHLSPKNSYRVRSSIEELVQQILLTVLRKPKINVIVEYNEHEDKTTVRVRYNGPAFDPEDTEDKLALAVLKSALSSFTYTPVEDGEYTNLVTMELAQES